MADMQPSDNGEDEREMFNFRIIDTADGNLQGILYIELLVYVDYFRKVGNGNV